ncbi:hypothetical protein ACA910_003723 [Epithemia clementina (nom. ined.)]
MGNNNSVPFKKRRSPNKSVINFRPEQSRKTIIKSTVANQQGVSTTTTKRSLSSTSNTSTATTANTSKKTESSPSSSSSISDVEVLDARRQDLQKVTLITPNEQLVASWIRGFDKHDIDAVFALTADDCVFDLVDSEMQMLASHFYESVGIIYASLPDFRFLYHSIKSIDEDRVLVKKYSGYGTHTGEPYSFGPYPPLEAKGIKFRDSPVDLTLTVKNGKIAHVICDAKGALVGPPGIYSKLGGILF